jgi:hypothetical protein
MKKEPDLRRYDHPKVVESLAVFDLLRRTDKYAPQVRDDLLARVAGVTGDPALKRVVGAWAHTWHLCKSDGPADWAMTIGLDTAKSVPEFGWSLGTYLTLPCWGQLPDGYLDDSIDIILPPLSLKWNPSRESAGDIRQKLSDAILREVEPQIAAVTTQYLDRLAPVRRQDADRAVTFLLRYQILEESYAEIAGDPNKFREQPERRHSYPVPDVKRDVDEAARQAGLQPRPSPRGRPPNVKQSRHISGRFNPRRP